MSQDTTANGQDVDPQLIKVFDLEILHQWDIATRSVSMMNAVLGDPSLDSGLFWFGMDAALGALGNISKVFFPLGKLHTEAGRRRAYMRRAYNITENSLLHSRDARNGFEHFDERLDTWFSNSSRKNFADRNISGPNGIVGLDSVDFARNYDPESKTITVFGVSLDFQALYSEVETLIQQVRSKPSGRHVPTAWK